MKGKLITFEGIDGSGKTTIVKMLSRDIKNAVITAEPTDTWLGEMVGRAIEEERNPATVAILFLADRIEHVGQIKKWIEEGKIVICDRYIDSTYAYQKEALKGIVENPEKWIDCLQKPFIIKPDLTILLNLPVSIAMDRIMGRKKIAYERGEFLERVQKNYMEMAKKEKRFVIIDAARGIEEVYKDCLNVISKFLSHRQDSV